MLILSKSNTAGMVMVTNKLQLQEDLLLRASLSRTQSLHIPVIQPGLTAAAIAGSGSGSAVEEGEGEGQQNNEEKM